MCSESLQFCVELQVVGSGATLLVVMRLDSQEPLEKASPSGWQLERDSGQDVQVAGTT